MFINKIIKNLAKIQFKYFKILIKFIKVHYLLKKSF